VTAHQLSTRFTEYLTSLVGLVSRPSMADALTPSLYGLQLLEIGQHFLAVTLRIDMEVHVSESLLLDRYSGLVICADPRTVVPFTSCAG